MARDKGLEALLSDSLARVPGLTQKAMFGGWAWLVNGNLLCAARSDGMLVRLGKENEAWALEIPGVALMVMRGRPMRGWLRAAPAVYANDALRDRLVEGALEFNRSLTSSQSAARRSAFSTIASVSPRDGRSRPGNTFSHVSGCGMIYHVGTSDRLATGGL